MSINVTVNGNPVSIRRGRMVLSDLDQVKKNERDRRRKLRLEQVRQQSKEISSRLLERAKNVSKTQLTQLEKDGRSELRQMHDQKIMDLQRKYQEDMEDIGRAHVSASLQPDVEALLEVDRRKNRFIATERGKEAFQRLKDSNQTKDDHAALYERQKQVREMENARASMIANLPKKSWPRNNSEQDSDSTGDDETVKKSPKKKRGRKTGKLQKSIPNVVVQSSDIQVVVSNAKTKRSEPEPGPSGVVMHRTEAVPKRSTRTNKTITDISELPRVTTGCESDDQEPRKCLPTLNSPSKADKVASYNPRDYKPDSSSSTSSTSSPTLSDDSSYFSDGVVEQMVSKKTPRHTTSAASSKVQLYDHNTKQRNAYDRPIGVVERINLNGEPNAKDLAQAVLKAESADSRLAENRRRQAQRRGHDAILRERVRRDYQNLLQNLDHLSREERKLKASQIHGPAIKDIHVNPVRRQELLEKRQREMDHAFETVAHNLGGVDDDLARPSERVVTIPPIDEHNNIESTPSAVWQEPPFFEPVETIAEDVERSKEMELSRDEQILEMLRKVERQKMLLLREFGADLPDNIFSASLKPLFSEAASTQTTAPKKNAETSPIPVIKVVNLSSCDETDKAKVKKGKKKGSAPPKRIEIAVQTSQLDEKGAAIDKSVQVELISGQRSSSSNSNTEETGERIKSRENTHREAVFETESNSGSSDSIETGIIIDMNKKQVKVTPRKRRSSLKISRRSSPRVVAKPRSVPRGKASTPNKKLSKSAPVSKQGTPRSNISNVQPIKITDKNLKIQVEKSGIKVQMHSPSISEFSRDTSSDNSKGTSIAPTIDRTVFYQKQTKSNIASDTSTSYSSPPQASSAFQRIARDNSTPVLEILENSENGLIRLKKRGISPVSSPGTPSPRTINLPTNTPHARQINRVLQYFDSTLSHVTDNNMSMLLPDEQSTPNEVRIYIEKNQKSSDTLNKLKDICSCKNPKCKLMHLNMEDIRNYATRNYPEILNKYQDLQSMCTDRIASLTDLIEKVRSEQRGMELSIGAHSNQSNEFSIPGTTTMEGDLHSVRKLVDSIEAIHNQLAKTLHESQRIIADDNTTKRSLKISSPPATSSISTETERNSVIPNSISANGQSSSGNNTRQTVSGRGIPKVISTETVNIPLSRFKRLPKPQTSMNIPPVIKPTSPSQGKSPRQEEDVVEQLSKEILEQSKAMDHILSHDSPEYRYLSSNHPRTSQNVSIMSPQRHKSPSPKKEQTTSPIIPDCSGPSAITSEKSTSKPDRNADFVPLLAGIPKVHRMPTSTTENHRPRPPVTLIYGPHRIQTGSPGHELSTIVEFDTPDTANRSQKSARSPTNGKSKKNLIPNYQMLAGQSASPSTRSQIPVHTSSPTAQTSAPKSPSKKSSTSPSKIQDTNQTSIRDEGTSGSPPALRDKCEATCPRIPTKSPQGIVRILGTQTDNGGSLESSSSIPDISMELSKRNLIFRPLAARIEADTPTRLIEAAQPVTSVFTEADKDKITSTSSNSFSGLSGISEITSTPTSDILRYPSSPEEMESALKKLGLGWAITTLKKTREASALSSSSNSDTTLINPTRKMISPVKKDLECKINCMPNLSDVSSISNKAANKSTERALLLKARTSTPNIENSNSSCDKATSSTTESSGASLQDPSDSLTAPNLSLTTKKTSSDKQLNGP